eukprot:TRINITY_DN374_c0_g1::TRINITY_DN374_c0_g1_i1::g.7593::m.7593 TRINITY_DN374_c0_g1::TRINITY_DN374_c0_g1_i1::g.7593  ORF type:complete len:306 (-),score=79.42,sp/Q9Z2Z6/MCAT_MOUSE/59.33/7e-122,Mito_carr/PF00153.22/5.1e-25,Mito_carr/PF00153.22/4.8e-24,Mito_carr/PF00153.22/4.2e-23 TRINITY_DN374_c0_g1_i1:281-1198(-)
MSDTKESTKPTSAWKSFVSGGAGGMCTVFVGHPLDTIKVRLQTMEVGLKPGEAAPYSGALDCAKKTIQKEGITGLYRGMAAPLVGVTPIFALCFFGYDMGRKLLRSDPNEQLSLTKEFLAGCYSGVLATAIMVPGDRIKCLLQIQGASSAPPQYHGPIDCARKVIKYEGIKGLYKGTVGTLWRDVPGSGMYFGGYEFAKRAMIPEGGSAADLKSWQTLMAGGCAGIANWFVSLPPDVLKSRFQTAPQGTYSSFYDVFRKTVKNEGYGALYKGVAPVMLRAFPANAACFFGMETSLKFLNWLAPNY